MADIDLVLDLERAEASYRPGEPIRGTVRVRFGRDVAPSARVLLRLEWRTSGPGNVEKGNAEEQVLASGPFLAGEQQSLSFDFPCPSGPFSTSHSAVSIGWELEARVDVKWAVDPVELKAVRVVPGPCERPYLGSRAEDVASQSPKFLSNADERRGYDSLVKVGAVGFVAFMIGATMEKSVVTLAGMAVVGAALCGGLVLLGVQFGRRSRFRGMTVELPNLARSVNAGFPVEARLVFEPRTSTSVEGMSAGWILEEHAENTHGTKTRTFGGEVQRSLEPVDVDEAQLAAGEQASLPFRVEGPSEPSFRGEKNRLDWALLVRVKFRGAPELVFKLPVLVRPPPPGAVLVAGDVQEDRGSAA